MALRPPIHQNRALLDKRFLGFLIQKQIFAVVMFPLPVRSIIFAFAQISEVYHKSEVHQVNRADAWQGRTNRECVPILA